MQLRSCLLTWMGAAIAFTLFAGCAASPQTQPDRSPPAGKPVGRHATFTPAGIDPDQAAAGWQIAKDRCSSCHAIDAVLPSPRPDAPPLRHVLDIYPDEMLAERLIEGMRIGHDDMPRFDFNVIAADSLVAYLKSIRSDEAPKKPSPTPGS
jgi:mono/diheme cytochrome c family protein